MIDGVGKGGRVVVDVGECDLCNELFSGELVVGEDPMPPGHPSCGCVARRPSRLRARATGPFAVFCAR